jgi:hypothetical protein
MADATREVRPQARAVLKLRVLLSGVDTRTRARHDLALERREFEP